MKNIVIFDLDGTLADGQHRWHFAKSNPPQWRNYYAACSEDSLRVPVAETLNALSIMHQIWIITGRSDEVRQKTLDWLERNDLNYDRLIMRKAGDKTSDFELKRSWLHDGTIPKEQVLMVFDDRNRVVDMWREEGLDCFQVAPGDF